MENEPIESITIVKADLELFRKYQKDILEIERGLIENSSSEYLIDEADELDFMFSAFEKGGYSYLAMREDKVVGFLVVGPLDDGSTLPSAIMKNFPVQNCLYIKVMYIKSHGKGIGSEMMEKLIEEVDKKQWKYLFVRTWVDPPNEGAINFYTKKAGFKIVPDAIVESTKIKKDNSGSFQIKRQYFEREM